MLRPSPRSKLFPYTTLFRSHRHSGRGDSQGEVGSPPLAREKRTIGPRRFRVFRRGPLPPCASSTRIPLPRGKRSEEHTSELQSQFHLVCRLLLEKKKKNQK